MSHAESVIVDGRPRTYRLHLPPVYSSDRSLPLVVVLHPRGGDGETMEATSGFSTVADREGVVVAYPDALGSPPSWHAFSGTEENIHFLEALLAELQPKFAVDPRRIYIAGHSSGAMMAYRFGAEFGDRLAAIGVVAGSMGEAEGTGPMLALPEPKHPLSVIVLHGKKDSLVPYDGGRGAKGDLRFESVGESVARWVRSNGCDPTPKTDVEADGSLIHQTYSGGKEGTEVVLCTLTEGGHGWPNHASEVLWGFFAGHSRRDR